MAIEFTEQQKKVLEARGHNVLVSAAAGSGKTAVLVERIIRMISEGPHPLDIDRLLVVTFTKAAAAEMRERIAKAVSQKLEEDPENRHLQRQETLLHHAQITTIDSFCTFLLRNNFSDIGLDPGFRQMDETENTLLENDVMQKFLEEQYVRKDSAFLSCVDYFCPGDNDAALESLILKLYRAADSHPYPAAWLEARRKDYVADNADVLMGQNWYQDLLAGQAEQLGEMERIQQAMLRIAEEPGGPFPYLDLLEKETEELSELCGKVNIAQMTGNGDRTQNGQDDAAKDSDCGWKKLREALLAVAQYPFAKLPAIRNAGKQGIDPEKKEQVQNLRKQLKARAEGIHDIIGEDPDVTVYRMQQAEAPLDTLITLTLRFMEMLESGKKKKNAISFSDLEHFALDILIDRREDGTLVLRKAAQEYRRHFAEVLIDEYQDSNEVQELLLTAVAGEKDAGFVMEGEGRFARFMVGDVKQSIYRFRNARPEIFQKKFDTYASEGPEALERERIDLDQNFRSRAEVLDAVNDVFTKIMRREIGGVEYDETVSLKPGADYPEEKKERDGSDPWQTELLIVDGAEKREDSETTEISGGSDRSGQDGEDSEDSIAGEIAELSGQKKEALAVAQTIRDLVGRLPVYDRETKTQRMARYGDIVILLRSTSGRQDAFREIFEKEGIPLYLEYKGGYFSAEEIRQVLQVLRVIDNPRQDIPLFGALRGYFGGFTLDEIGQIRAEDSDRKALLYDCLLKVSAPEDRDQVEKKALREKCREFLSWLNAYREKVPTTPIHELIGDLIRNSGYEDYVRALPGGQRRAANLHSLLVKAAAFEQTDYAGLFRFLRSIDQMHEFDVDYGEASVLDEHADVVRMTTIHKSKGLEYPICFVCGLGSLHPFRRDLSGMMITDTDAGIGVNYVNTALRAAVPTLRQKAVASKMERDALGEELRILYVAMTRAKEKLILTGYVKDADSYMKKVNSALSAAELPAVHLPVSVITAASGYLQLLLESVQAMKAEGKESIRVSTIPVTDLALSQIEDQETLGQLKGTLHLLENGGLERLPVPTIAAGLSSRFSWQYPHENMRGLYTKTTVSELKHAAMVDAGILTDDRAPEGPDEMYPDRMYTDPDTLPKPGWVKEEELSNTGTDGGRSDAKGSAGMGGAERGTAIHRFCELIDYHSWNQPAIVTEEMFETRVGTLVGKGEIPGSYVPVLTPDVFLPFLRSGVASRMSAADAEGLLEREQPFVLGIAANRLNPAFSESETILIQGIIDAFFIEKHRNIVVVDYKTDRVHTGQQLIDRYQVQLDYYAEALEKMLGLPVTEKIIYSFQLQEEILLP